MFDDDDDIRLSKHSLPSKQETHKESLIRLAALLNEGADDEEQQPDSTQVHLALSLSIPCARKLADIITIHYLTEPSA